MDDFSRALEKCSAARSRQCEQPKEPHIDLKEAEALYKELHEQLPRRSDRMDLVTYLIGFAAKEDEREDEAMERFQEVIDEFPQSPLYGDAWMMVGEHYFARRPSGPTRRTRTRTSPTTRATSDLATVQDRVVRVEARRHRRRRRRTSSSVLDKAVEAERSGTEAQRRRSASLRDEALEYLVVVFTEDSSISAKEVFDFLGVDRRRAVLARRARSRSPRATPAQTEWDRSNEAYRFLIKMDPESIKAAEYQRDDRRRTGTARSISITRRRRSRSSSTATARTRRGPRQQKNRDALARSLDDHRGARARHRDEHPRRGAAPREALQLAKSDGCVTRPTIPADLCALQARRRRVRPVPGRVRHRQDRAPSKATEIRYYRADILCFKLGKLEEAGDEYLAVGKTAPVGKFHKEALLKTRWPRSRRRARRTPPASTSSTRSTRSSARRSISTRRCSPPTRRSSA